MTMGELIFLFGEIIIFTSMLGIGFQFFPFTRKTKPTPQRLKTYKIGGSIGWLHIIFLIFNN